MGTSRAAKAPATVKWANVIGSLKSPQRNAATIVNTTFSVAMGALESTVPVSIPIFWAASEGLRFSMDVRNKGIDYAVEHQAIRVAERFVIPSISTGLWQIASSRMTPKLTESAFGKLAELAFKKTMNAIMAKGVEALVES